MTKDKGIPHPRGNKGMTNRIMKKRAVFLPRISRIARIGQVEFGPEGARSRCAGRLTVCSASCTQFLRSMFLRGSRDPLGYRLSRSCLEVY
jgi:hypothetical protein